MPQDPKKVKMSGTKEDEAEDTATNRPEAMDQEMPELISDDDEVTPLQKEFTLKKPPLCKPPCK